MRNLFLSLGFLILIPSLLAEPIRVGGRKIHAEMRGPATAPPLVLLSGPTDHWHSDSAWWALALQELSRDYRVIAIDRPGFGFSDPVPEPSYTAFAQDLAAVLEQLKIQKAVLIGFASADLAIFPYVRDHAKDGRVRGLILIDPDVLTPLSIARYQKDAEPFQKNAASYQKMIEAGGRMQREKELNKTEKAEIQALIGPMQQKLDWTYFDSILAQRETIAQQKALFAEIAAYGRDLNSWKTGKVPTDLPMVIVDSDFELSFINAGTAKPEADELKAWAKDGSDWYRSLVKAHPKSQYVHYPHPEHVRACFDIPGLRQWIQMLP